MERTSSLNDINDGDVNNAKHVDEIYHVFKPVTEVALLHSKYGEATEDVNAISKRKLTSNVTELGIINQETSLHLGSKGSCSEDNVVSTDINDRMVWYEVSLREGGSRHYDFSRGPSSALFRKMRVDDHLTDCEGGEILMFRST